jgi:hypothetical protein
MFVVAETDAAAIRTGFDRGGERSAVIELRRLFPGITDNEKARECARTIAGWTPLPHDVAVGQPQGRTRTASVIQLGDPPQRLLGKWRLRRDVDVLELAPRVAPRLPFHALRVPRNETALNDGNWPEGRCAAELAG